MLGDHEGEIIELVIPEEPAHPEILDLPLRELDLPTGCLLGAVIRDGTVSIASGSTVLQAKDKVLVVVGTSAISAVETMFR